MPSPLFVRDDGPADGEPVLMLHSLFFDGSMFDDVIELMRLDGGDQWRYLRPDHLGQARSAGHGDDDLGMDRLAAVLAEWIGQNVKRPVHLVGSSMGGYVALRLLLDHPELVASCALLGASAHAEPEPARFAELATALETRGPAALVDTLAWTMFGDALLARKEDWTLLRWRKAFAERPTDVAAAVRGVAARTSVDDRLNEINLPLLLIAGEQDHAKPAWHMRDIADRVPNRRLVVLSDAGHTPAVERPAPVASELSDWIEAATNTAESTTPSGNRLEPSGKETRTS